MAPKIEQAPKYELPFCKIYAIISIYFIVKSLAKREQ